MFFYLYINSGGFKLNLQFALGKIEQIRLKKCANRYKKARKRLDVKPGELQADRNRANKKGEILNVFIISTTRGMQRNPEVVFAGNQYLNRQGGTLWWTRRIQSCRDTGVRTP